MALTIGTWTRVSAGNKFLVYASVTGDSVPTKTIKVPLGKVEAAWTQNVTETVALQIASISGATISYASSTYYPTNTLVHKLFAIGTD